jgi:phosphatidylglycerol:prolipoprotein diacylglycerol transferase
MYPYIHIGSMQIGTFGLMLWLAAVCATVVLHKNFLRNKIDADALNVVTLVVLAGQILLPGLSHPLEVLMNFLRWFQAGFAWYGGLLAGIITLMVLGTTARFKGPLEGTLGARIGPLRMLDLAAPATAIGYGIGRIGCLTSGDGDYGINTTLPWGVHMAQNALVPPTPPDALVQPTPVYELLYALLLFWLLWKLGERYRPVGWMTGLYLVLSGIGRFLVEFVRINPKLYFHHTMSNAQVAALGSVLLGAVLLAAAARINQPWVPRLADTSVA